MKEIKLPYRSSGFTLLELMVALTLGLIISAAAIQIFITSQRDFSSQQGYMDLQNSSLFGMGTMVREIRLANLNKGQAYMDDKKLYGGIVLSANNLSSNRKEDGSLNFSIDTNLLTRGEIGPSRPTFFSDR
ncbi:PilW family protein [Acinetobacter ursingii]|uniref:PilW family protein n=1 Tax=Acinetobacter ursingii TaxID=108980 RepID=UPI001D183E19|nr:prepilin-type N-terminal cleavage/methylation domain-containing protein [Acinetobacter ursingii]